jgi:hypothetical protein
MLHLGVCTFRPNEDLRLGFHNLRYSLASFLVRDGTDVKTAQALLRHADVKTTLQLYTQSGTENRMTAQGAALEAILSNADENVLGADGSEFTGERVRPLKRDGQGRFGSVLHALGIPTAFH